MAEITQKITKNKRGSHNSNNNNNNNNKKKKNRNHNNNDNGNFVCVFECTIVNLATYRQFTDTAWDWIIPKEKEEGKKIKISSSLGYPN